MARSAFAYIILGLLVAVPPVHANPDSWRAAGWKTDFAKTTVDFAEIISGGPPRDGIPSIDRPVFRQAAKIDDIGANEPVIRLEVGGVARAYPLRVLTWHEIVNDTVAGIPVAVTYCPLCNSAVVFDRTQADGSSPQFGVSGLLRNSDMVMYDRETQSWWQQFTGTAIVGARAGQKLKMIPSRVEAFADFARDHPKGDVLVPNDPARRPYGRNPYVGYDSRQSPFPLYTGDLPAELEPMMRVVVVPVGDGIVAVTLAHLREKGTVSAGDVTLTWRKGVNSALDGDEIAKGADVGAVQAARTSDGAALVHDVTFAFVVHAFHPGATILTEKGPVTLTSR